jgi:hypothetical protein
LALAFTNPILVQVYFVDLFLEDHLFTPPLGALTLSVMSCGVMSAIASIYIHTHTHIYIYINPLNKYIMVQLKLFNIEKEIDATNNKVLYLNRSILS